MDDKAAKIQLIESPDEFLLYVLKHIPFLIGNLQSLAECSAGLVENHKKAVKNINNLSEKYAEDEEIINVLNILLNCAVLLKDMGKIFEDVKERDETVTKTCNSFIETLMPFIKGKTN